MEWRSFTLTRNSLRGWFSDQDFSTENEIAVEEYIAWEQLADVFTHQ